MHASNFLHVRNVLLSSSFDTPSDAMVRARSLPSSSTSIHETHVTLATLCSHVTRFLARYRRLLFFHLFCQLFNRNLWPHSYKKIIKEVSRAAQQAIHKLSFHAPTGVRARGVPVVGAGWDTRLSFRPRTCPRAPTKRTCTLLLKTARRANTATIGIQQRGARHARAVRRAGGRRLRKS